MKPDVLDSVQKSALNRAMAMAVRLLSVRNHTGCELLRKLKQRGIGPDLADRVVSDCIRLKYVNDEETARYHARWLMEKGNGRGRVRQALKKRGISQDLAQTVIEEISEDDEFTAARKAASVKMRSLTRETDPRKRREKMFRFLYSRGFDRAMISRLLQQDDTP